MRISQFFEDDNGELSAMRLYGFIALIVAVVLTFQQPVDFQMVLTWLIFSFSPKTLQKIIESKIGNGNKK